MLKKNKEKIIYVIEEKDCYIVLSQLNNRKYAGRIDKDLDFDRRINNAIESCTNTLNLIEVKGEEFYDKMMKDFDSVDIRKLPDNPEKTIYPVVRLSEKKFRKLGSKTVLV